jgi:hypothetical protein
VEGRLQTVLLSAESRSPAMRLPAGHQGLHLPELDTVATLAWERVEPDEVRSVAVPLAARGHLLAAGLSDGPVVI